MLARASQPEWPCARSPCTPSSTFRGLVFTTMLLLVSDRHHNHQNGSTHHRDHQPERQSSSEWQLSSSWSSVRAANIFRATIIIRVTVVIIKIISSGDLAISGWMSLKLLVTTLLAIVKKPGASTDWTVNKVRNSFFSHIWQTLNP